MGWTDSALKLLKDTFGNRPFSVEEAARALKKEKAYSKNAVYQVLHELAKKGFLIRLGRGIYSASDKGIAISEEITLSDKVTVEVTSEALKKAEEILEKKGIEFMVTGPSTLTRFHHHLPRRLIHLIYVIDGAGEFATKSLEEANLRALLNPNREEVEMALKAFEERDILVIREFAELEGNVNGRACLERALVDTYVEATRRRIPYSELEVGRIIASVFRSEKINIARLLRLAGRRGVKSEFKSITKEIIPNLPLTNATMNEHVENVLHGIRE
jgi:hypothetical protein